MKNKKTEICILSFKYKRIKFLISSFVFSVLNFFVFLSLANSSGMNHHSTLYVLRQQNEGATDFFPDSVKDQTTDRIIDSHSLIHEKDRIRLDSSWYRSVRVMGVYAKHLTEVGSSGGGELEYVHSLYSDRRGYARRQYSLGGQVLLLTQSPPSFGAVFVYRFFSHVPWEPELRLRLGYADGLALGLLMGARLPLGLTHHPHWYFALDAGIHFGFLDRVPKNIVANMGMGYAF